MKLKKIYINYILLSVLLIFFTDSVSLSQSTDKSEEIIHPKLFISISIGPSKNQIINEQVLSLSELSSGNRNSYSGSFDLGYFFSKSVGLSTGLGYESYSTELLLNSYTNNYNTADTENETYERRIKGSAINELQKISFLNIPVCIDFRIPLGNRFGIYLQTGINLSLPLSQEYNSSGIFTFTGYYPAYNVLLQNLPDYGFVNNSNVNSKGNLELKSYIIDGLARAGFQLFISSKIQVGLGVDYKRSLSSISNYSSPDDFKLSSDVSQINSMMGGSSKSIAEAMGLRLSIRYYIK